jgi:tRNA splicing ligase
MNMFKITVSSHGRTIEIISVAETMGKALTDVKQANKNAYTRLTQGDEIDTEGEIIKCEKLEQLFAGFNGRYYM